MLIGVPKEIKTHEYRVGLVPASVRELVHHDHAMMVEGGAGQGIGFNDEDYRAAGAAVVDTAEEVFTPISQVNSIFDALRWRFCYKNQYVEALMEWFAWHTRWVNRNGTDFGSISTAA